jgi:hypothetical protein
MLQGWKWIGLLSQNSNILAEVRLLYLKCHSFHSNDDQLRCKWLYNDQAFG